jgi:hypothetical protein
MMHGQQNVKLISTVDKICRIFVGLRCSGLELAAICRGLMQTVRGFPPKKGIYFFVIVECVINHR